MQQKGAKGGDPEEGDANREQPEGGAGGGEGTRNASAKGEGEKTDAAKRDRQLQIARTRLLIKFEIERRNEEDAIKMARIIARAANLKKNTIHAVAKFLFEQCLAEYRANKMLE